MADTNHTRRDDYLEFSEDDPFAELTRIMGHDPREAQPAAPVKEQAIAAPALVEGEVDFALELERELAGDLDFSDFDAPAAQADWPVEQEVAARVDTFQSVPVEPSAPEQFELDSDFDAFFAEETAAREPAIASYDAYHPETPAGGMDQGYESLGDALEQELLAEQAIWAEPEPVSLEPAYEAEPAYEVAAYSQEPLSAAIDVQPQATEDDWAIEAEFDVDFLERELAASTATNPSTATDQWQSQPYHEAMTPPPASFEAEPFGEMAVVEAVEQAVEDLADEEPVERPLSLEEELQLLLADEPLPVAPRVVSPAASFTTAVNLGRANFSATPPEAAELARSTVEEDVFNPSVTPPVTPAETYQPYQSYQPSAEPAVELFVEEFAELPDEQPAGSLAEIEFSTSAGDEAADDFGDIFDDDFALQLDDMIDEEILAEPVAASAPELPDIETVEVAEIVPPVTDDLDIPEIDYGTTATAAPDFHDDFQSDFDHLFGDVTTGEARPAAVAASMVAPVAGAQMPGAQIQGAQIQGEDNYFHQDMQWQMEQPAPDLNYASDTDYHYETDLEQAIASSTYEDEPAPSSSRRRGLFVAAAIGGVVALGGLGVFGMSMLGGGSDNPVIVRADPDPMKVRPENPGGTTVPNQDNQVYQRVSGAGSDAGPRQEQLITSAEEPVDVVARTVTPQEPASTLAPGVEDEAAQAGPAAETRPVKSEERIEPTSPATSPVEAQETAIVTPRRVRTMVVRPDGTMVPREEPAAVVTAPETIEPAVAGQAVAGQAVTEEASALVPMDQPVQPAGEIDDGPTLEMPQTVSVVPTQRSQAVQTQQPVATAQPAAPQPAAPTQQVAAAPVAAPAPATAAAAAAGNEWSMQIASQPTAEGAQASYQDLARRYGSVLEGRGVNIVRADIDGRGTYYRVRIPASSRDEAIQLCTRYKAVGGSCFVSR